MSLLHDLDLLGTAWLTAYAPRPGPAGCYMLNAFMSANLLKGFAHPAQKQRMNLLRSVVRKRNHVLCRCCTVRTAWPSSRGSATMRQSGHAYPLTAATQGAHPQTLGCTPAVTPACNMHHCLMLADLFAPLYVAAHPCSPSSYTDPGLFWLVPQCCLPALALALNQLGIPKRDQIAACSGAALMYQQQAGIPVPCCC
jgi:hypothetical protein